MKTQNAAFSAASELLIDYTILQKVRKVNMEKIKHESIRFTFPAVMKQLNQWLLWELKNNKKIPLNTNYSVTDPTKGFSFSDVVCVDIDHCILDEEN